MVCCGIAERGEFLIVLIINTKCAFAVAFGEDGSEGGVGRKCFHDDDRMRLIYKVFCFCFSIVVTLIAQDLYMCYHISYLLW